MHKTERIRVLGILAFALVLLFGIGLRLYHIADVQNVDEPNVVKHAVLMADGQHHIEWYNWPAQSLMRLDAVPIFLLTQYHSFTQTETSAAELYQKKPELFSVAARSVTVVFFVLSAGFLFIIGRRLQGLALGLLASLFLAVDYLHVIHSRFATPDVPMATALLANLALAIYIIQRPISISKKKDKKLFLLFLLAGSITGFALATKYTGLLSLIPIFLIFVYSPKLLRSFFPAVGMFLLGALLSHTLFNPFAWVDWQVIIKDLLFEAKPSRIGVDFGGKGNVFLKNLVYYLKGSLVWNGTVITLCAYLTILWSLFRARTSRWMLVSIISIFYCFILLGLSSLGLHWSRWAIPLTVLTVLEAAIGITFFFLWIKQFIPTLVSRIALFLAIVAMCLAPVYLDIAFAQSTASLSIAQEMNLYILDNIPKGSKIVSDTWFLKSKNHTIIEKQVSMYTTSVAEYKAEGVSYVIVKPFRKGYAKREQDQYQHILNFFKELKESGTLLVEFPNKKCISVLDHKRDYAVYTWIWSNGLNVGTFCNGSELQLYQI